MTDAKQKPREFWISDPEEFSEDFIFNDQKYTNDDSRYIHVIDKQEYDKLLVRIERTKSAAYHALLQMSAWIGIPEHKRMEQIKHLMVNINYCADIDIQDDEAKNE